MSRMRLLVAGLVVSLATALTAIGLIVWMAVDPQYWFPGAYAPQGVQGEPGPRGPVGAQGPPGPVGPDASAAIDDLTSRLDDLETGNGDQAPESVEDLSSRVDDVASRVDDVESSADDASTKIDAVCDAFSVDAGALFDVYASAC